MATSNPIAVASRLNTFQQGLSNGTSTAHMTRVRHQCPKPCTQIRFVYTNFYQSSDVDTDGANTITVKASVEYPASTFTPVTFSAASSTTVAAGATVVSDPVSVNVATAGDYLYSRTYVTVTSGQKWPTGLVTILANGEGVETDGADKTASGTVTASTSFCYSPAAVIGTVSPLHAAVLVFGDSISLGFNDTGGGTFLDRGYAWRAFGSAATYTFFQASYNGAKAFEQSATNATRRRLLYHTYATHAIVMLGTNDFGGRTLALMQTALTTLWTQLNSLGVKVYAATIPPRTTSTDSWATTGNQTVTANEVRRTDLNDWIRTTPSPLTGYFEIADICETSRNSGKWIVTGAANYATTDGIHPSPAVHALMAAGVTTASFDITPAAPAALAATAFSTTRIDLTWTQYSALSSLAEAITLQYGTASDFTGATTVTDIGVDASTYSVTGLTAGTLYYFRIKLDSVSGTDSDWSSSASATTNAAGGQSMGIGTRMGLGM